MKFGKQYVLRTLIFLFTKKRITPVSEVFIKTKINFSENRIHKETKG